MKQVRTYTPFAKRVHARSIKKINLRHRIKKLFSFKLLVKVSTLGFIIVGLNVLSLGYMINNRYDSTIVSVLEEVEAIRVAMLHIKIDASGDLDIQSGDKLDVAFELYRQGKIRKILIGTNVENSLESSIIPAHVRTQDVKIDHLSANEFELCLRARTTYGLSSAILISQEFDLARFLYVCEGVGLSGTGVTADRHLYQDHTLLKFQELFKNVQTYYQLYVLPPNIDYEESIHI